MIFLVGARARYVLVDAVDETEARAKGQELLRELYSELWRRDMPNDVSTVRPASDEEVQRWHARGGTIR